MSDTSADVQERPSDETIAEVAAMEADAADAAPNAEEEAERAEAEADADATAAETALDSVFENEPPVEALAGALSNTAQQYAAAEQAERRQEVDDVEGVFDGPYDPAKAMTAITRLNRECEAAEKEYLASKEQTSGFKKSFEARQHSLSKLISQYAARSRDVKQPYLQPVGTSDDPAVRPMCPFERDTKQPCPICRSRKPGDTPLEEAPANPNHAEHQAAARAAALQSLSFALLGRQCFLSVEELAGLSDFDRETLRAWTKGRPGPVYPALLVRAHIAGEPGTDGQHCTKCGAALTPVEESTPYKARSFVGFGCEGDRPEAARPVAKRGSKKTKKVNPETERVEQAKAGRKKTAKKPHTPAKKRGRA